VEKPSSIDTPYRLIDMINRWLGDLALPSVGVPPRDFVGAEPR